MRGQSATADVERARPATLDGMADPAPRDLLAVPSPDAAPSSEARGRRGTAHPANTLNELSGEEWLYFTKSVWSTAYPSELGHARRKAHGANKPPRLMCRLIEFFSKTGELVLDPFAGVGGTLLGAAIAQGPRRALGIELDPRWIDVFRARSRSWPPSAAVAARSSPTSGRATPAACAPSIRQGWSSAGPTPSRRCRGWPPARSTSSPRIRRTTSSCR